MSDGKTVQVLLQEARDRDAELGRLRQQQRFLKENLPGRHFDEMPLWAHCENVGDEYVCPEVGEPQERVTGIRERFNQTCADLDGDYQGPNATTVERSFDYYTFADASEAPCKTCGRDRAIGPQQRPSYRNASRKDPRKLLDIIRENVNQGFGRSSYSAGDVIPGVKQDDRVSALERELAELRALVKGNGNGHAPEPESTIVEPDPDPPTRANAWTTVEQYIYRRPLKAGGETFVVKIRGFGKASAKTLEEAREIKAGWLGERES